MTQRENYQESYNPNWFPDQGERRPGKRTISSVRRSVSHYRPHISPLRIEQAKPYRTEKQTLALAKHDILGSKQASELQTQKRARKPRASARLGFPNAAGPVPRA